MTYSNFYFARLRPLFSLLAAASLLIVGITTAQAVSPFELVTHPTNVYGVDKVASGDLEIGIKRLNMRLGSETQARSVRAPILIDLCVGYTMLKEFEAASKACNQAVDIGWYSGLAYNNRGVLNIAKGDYEAAIRDFQAAIDESGADRVAGRNLDRATERLAEVKAQRTDTYLVQVNDEG